MSIYDPIKIKDIRPLKDNVIVRDMNFGERQLSSKIILPSDDGKSSGVRPRWAKVFRVGPEQHDIEVGQWVLVSHGRWTRGSDVDLDGETMTIRRIDPKDVLIISDEEPSADDIISDKA